MNTKTFVTLHNHFVGDRFSGKQQGKTSLIRYCALFVMMLMFSASQGQTLNKTWKEDLTITLDQFLNCTVNEKDKSVCASFIEKSMAAVYKLDAFNLLASTNSNPALVGTKSGQWSVIGMGFDQKALESAQRFANENKAVIAVYKPNGGSIKHVALILPGSLQYSGSWGYNVPNSASFFITTPEKSYINRGLSYAFGKCMLLQVTLYVRNN